MKPAETLALTRDTGAIAPPLSANRVLRNTYWLLSLTLLFSAGLAGMGGTTGCKAGPRRDDMRLHF